MITIVTPSYNSSSYISETIRSVMAQKYVDWEMIIVDDCSVDDSVSVIQSFVDRDPRIKLIRSEKNCGAAISRNLAIENARGRYIAFLDSDDRWRPDKLKKQLEFMQKNDIAFSYTSYEKFNKNNEIIGKVSAPLRVSYSDLLKVCSIGCLTAMYDTEKLGKVYMPLIRKRQDAGLWLRILKEIPYAYGLDEVLAQYRVRADSISANKVDAARYTWRLYRDVEKLSLPMAVYYFSHYAVNGALRAKFPRLANALGKV